jgi:hypothetical protein
MSETAENKAGSYHIPKEVKQFDPRWEPIYNIRGPKMGRNQASVNEQVACNGDQIMTMTQVVNQHEQELHELRSLVEQMQKDNKVATNNKPDAPAKRGRPPKEKKEEASE